MQLERFIGRLIIKYKYCSILSICKSQIIFISPSNIDIILPITRRLSWEVAACGTRQWVYAALVAHGNGFMPRLWYTTTGLCCACGTRQRVYATLVVHVNGFMPLLWYTATGLCCACGTRQRIATNCMLPFACSSCISIYFDIFWNRILFRSIWKSLL